MEISKGLRVETAMNCCKMGAMAQESELCSMARESISTLGWLSTIGCLENRTVHQSTR